MSNPSSASRSPALLCRIYFDSRRQTLPPELCALGGPSSVDGEPPLTACVDLASSSQGGEGALGAEQIARLGISSERDLPALALAEPGGKVRLLGLRLSAEEIARLAAGQGLPSERLVVYSSSWCPDCRNAKRVLHEADTSFDEVDIDQDPNAEALVLERSGGRRVVPTLRFGDRLWAFNPAPPLLRRLLASAP